MTSAPASRPLWIGTFPADPQAPGQGEGVWRVDVGADGRFGEPRLVVELEAPTFLALHPSGRALYAVTEADPGSVTALEVEGAEGTTGLRRVRTVPSGGSSPCHVAVADDVLWLANYGDGNVTWLALDAETGGFGQASGTFRAEGSGPDPERQDGPHAHFAAFVPPSGRTGAGADVLVCDLGLDVVRRYPARPWPDGAGATPAEAAAQLPPGSGPRHLAVLPGGALVVAGELDGRLHVLAPEGTGDAGAGADAAAGWAVTASVPVCVTEPAEGSPVQPSHVQLTRHPAGDLVTVGVRGSDVLAVHRVHGGDGPAPTLEHLADVPLGQGAFPRHHAVLGPASPDQEEGPLLAVVARQGTGDLASVLLDPATGRGDVVAGLALATPPACVLEA
ncbi:hypothetical protein DNL40_15655 [Xylanimonas oleitrophica]|uniref:Lactonase family protein n=1 Tax=Xylanimonas oleitrophica TaxID=2607479 RepID=A0A2W5WLN6_9MICO|nr:beta-propeller fold lactonase family protein [Xylanimonas oleitrophica]PZR51603.1 hypothetical protein DNL40_15655 [Xylanimonas oleitrophica]